MAADLFGADDGRRGRLGLAAAGHFARDCDRRHLGATGLAAGSDPGATWVGVFAFLTTSAVVYSTMKRDAWLNGVGIAVAWGAVGAAVLEHGAGPAWMSIFAFLTAGAVANSLGERGRGLAAVIWWGAAGLIVVAAGAGWAWLGVIAFLLTALSLGVGSFSFPSGIEWDLWDRDGDDERVKIVR